MIKKAYLYLIIVCLYSCSSEVVLTVQKPPQYDVNDIEYIQIGRFNDLFRKKIDLPNPPQGKNYENFGTLKPSISSFRSNSRAAELMRASLIAEISKAGRYKLINTQRTDFFSGVQPAKSKTAIIDCNVAYYEFSKNGSEEQKFELESSKNVGSFSISKTSSTSLKAKNSYTEIIGAISIEFEFTRASNGEKLIPNKTINTYYTRKWGGLEDTSSLPKTLKQVIQEIYQQDESLVSKVTNIFEKAELRFENPREFLARGGNLKKNSDVPLTPLDMRIRLVQQAAKKYLETISYSKNPVYVELAGGNDIGAKLVENNAFRHAINYLEALEDKESEDFYNLALSYEAIGEKNRAVQLYEKAIQEQPNNELYQKALKRVQK